jgi:hypothetical protein
MPRDDRSMPDKALAFLKATPPGRMVAEAVDHVLRHGMARKALASPAFADLLRSTTWLGGELGLLGIASQIPRWETLNVLRHATLPSFIDYRLPALPQHTYIPAITGSQIGKDFAAIFGLTKISEGVEKYHDRFEYENAKQLAEQHQHLTSTPAWEEAREKVPFKTPVQGHLDTARSLLQPLKGIAGIAIYAHHDPLAFGSFAALAGASAAVAHFQEEGGNMSHTKRVLAEVLRQKDKTSLERG